MSANSRKAAGETAAKMAAAGRETVETVVKMGADAAAESRKAAADLGREQIERAGSACDRAAAYGRDNLGAASEAAAAAVAGWEAWCEGVADYAATAFAENMDLMQRFAAAKTPQEVLDLQAEGVSRAVSRALAQSAKLNRIASDAAAGAFAPIGSRIDEAVAAAGGPGRA